MKGPLPRGQLPGDQTALYRFYAADGELLYIGITQDLETRWRSHERSKIWWADIARKEYVIVKSRGEAKLLEHAAIRTENPRYDRTRPGHFPTDGIVYKKPLDDPYQEGIVAQVERALQADLVSGVFPAWSLLPTVAALARRYETSKAAVDHALTRLAGDDLLAPTKTQYINAPRKGFPEGSARRNGPHFVMAAHLFGFESFSAKDLLPYVPHGIETVSQRLSILCRDGLARCVARKPVGRYVLTKMPDPDPVKVPPATSQDVAEMEAWLVRQVKADQRSTSDEVELARFQRDLAVIEACSRYGAEVLAEMAYFYANRAGYQDLWRPHRLGGARKPTF